VRTTSGNKELLQLLLDAWFIGEDELTSALARQAGGKGGAQEDAWTPATSARASQAATTKAGAAAAGKVSQSEGAGVREGRGGSEARATPVWG
jgi:hypothetical protein